MATEHIEEHNRPFQVCDTCRGSGSHVNPAIDGHGITESEMQELGDDFRDDYLSGVYDVPCYECKGLRVTKVPCLCKNCEAERDEAADYAALVAAELRAGC